MPLRTAIVGVVVSTGVLAEASLPLTEGTSFMGILERFGLATALLIYFIWQYGKLVKEVNRLKDKQHEEHTNIIRQNTEALKRVAKAVEKCPRGD